MFIHFKRHVLYFTIESAIAKRRIIDCEEECTQLLGKNYNHRPKIIKGMNAKEYKHSCFLRVYRYFILFRYIKNTLFMQFLETSMHKPLSNSLKDED